jgi:hypothetical protein
MQAHRHEHVKDWIVPFAFVWVVRSTPSFDTAPARQASQPWAQFVTLLSKLTI